MSRVASLEPEDLTPEQKKLYDEIAGARGRVGGPFGIWLRQPALADPANRFGNALRLHGKLDRRLFELMTIIVARHWGAQYEWFVHADHGRKAGLTDEVIEAVRNHRIPAFAREDERLVYDIVSELNETRRLSDASYQRALDFFGLDLLVELITATGFYTLVAMMLNAFDVDTPDGSRPLA
ncbi:MAG: carboxymuconolactone decarboxylase family protein [Rhizobiales bacterium]|nr:carboxymuconolactone decarboxylase family protein [Hyphomicrobiales bacterium]